MKRNHSKRHSHVINTQKTLQSSKILFLETEAYWGVLVWDFIQFISLETLAFHKRLVQSGGNNKCTGFADIPSKNKNFAKKSDFCAF